MTKTVRVRNRRKSLNLIIVLPCDGARTEFVCLNVGKGKMAGDLVSYECPSALRFEGAEEGNLKPSKLFEESRGKLFFFFLKNNKNYFSQKKG